MNYQQIWLQLKLICSFIFIISTPTHAQIIPDNTLGAESSRLTPNVEINGANAQRIDGGAGRGNNLFHSFSEFNVGNGQRVYFDNPSGIQNILTRVTGGNASNILGTLGVDGAANLFLINPNGILFGPNARLDVRGSFVGTTANGVRFGEQGVFSATNPEAPPLLTVNPSGLLFNQITAASIQNNSRASAGLDPTGFFNTFGLRVPNGQSLVLVGGDVNINSGGIVAFGGHIDIGGVKGTGTVGLNQNGNNFSLSFPNDLQRANVSLTDRAGFIVTADSGGSITLTGENINISNNSSITAGISGIGSVNSQAGDITLDATGLVTVANNSFIFNSLDSGALGNSGNVIVKAKRLNINNGGQVGVLNFGKGNTANVTIQASEAIELTGGNTGFVSGLFAQVTQQATGNSGNLTINTDTLLVRDGAVVNTNTFGAGQGGSLTVNAKQVQLIGTSSNNQRPSGLSAETESDETGAAGNLTINTDTLLVREGAIVSTDTFGAGKGGNLTVNAKQVQLIGTSSDGRFIGGLKSQANSNGDAGNLTINTDSLLVKDGPQISSSTFGTGNAGILTVKAIDSVTLSGESRFPGGIFAQVDLTGSGNGGSLTIETQRLSVSDGSKIQVSTFSQEQGGKAGELLIRAEEVEVFETKTSFFSTGIFAEVSRAVTPDSPITFTGKGSAGNLIIETRRLNIRNGGQVSSSTFGEGNAGSLIVRSQDSVEVSGKFSLLSTEVNPNAKGQGGNLQIDTPKLIIQDDGLVAVRSRGEGTAGNLNINANSIYLKNQGRIDAESASGNGGNINLQIRDFLLLRGNSLISATAGTDQKGGDGGNITINTPFIVAVPQENSDIIANAYSGKGGNVNIRARSIFGIEARSLATPSTSDITASSQLGVQGQINITQPDVQPTQGLIELPGQVLDASNQIAQVCPRSPYAKPLGEFIVSGRGGSLPPSPLQPLSGTTSLAPLATLDHQSATTKLNISPTPATAPTSPAIVEAQGWVKTPEGKIMLVAQAPQATPSTRPTTAACPLSQ